MDCGTGKRTGATDGVIAPVRVSTVRRSRALWQEAAAIEAGCRIGEGRCGGLETTTAPAGAVAKGGVDRAYLPSSNTTSRLTETLLSPGATGVLSISAFIAIARIIGIGGRTPPLLPSEMLTMRRTCRPSALA